MQSRLLMWQRWLRQPRSVTLRKAFFQVHLWTGIAIGLYVVAICLSGSVLVYRNELYSAFAPEPGGPIPLGFRLTAWLLDFHDNLLSGGVGRRVNGVFALLVLAMCATGAVIWWPGVRNWWTATKVDWHANRKRFVWTLHGALGFWFFVFILMWAFSGTYLAYPAAFQAFFDYVEPLDEDNPVERVGDTIQYGIAYLHFGRLGGRGIIPGCGRGVCNEMTKAIWASVALVPPIMVVTGLMMWWNRRRRILTLLLAASMAAPAHGQAAGTIVVVVTSADGVVEKAEVRAGTVSATTGADGTTSLSVPAGRVDVVVTHAGYDAAATSVDVRAGEQTRVAVEMQPQSEIEETIIVSATRSERRIEDEPLRVEVVPEEEVQEKIAMTPGDVSMLLAETNGLRVQATSPSIGGANIRIQGLNGRYTQVLSDGLPLYGGQSGSVGILQIPPIDLAQVEVIKGVASALYGMSAIGGVVNLVSRRPRVDTPEQEILLNATSHRGMDAALWVARALNEQWGVSVLAGVHTQDRSDLDDDGWTDLPFYRRGQGRARFMWDNGGGRSLLFTAGGMTEQRRGGTMPGAETPDGNPYAETLDTTRVDSGLVGRFLTAGGRVLAIRASGMTQRRDRTFGAAAEQDRSGTWFGESSLTGTSGRHTWVGGAALQRDTFDSASVPRFDFAYTTPGIFAQDEYAVSPRVTVSGSGRADYHSEFGAFVSPRVSALVRPGGPITVRLSAGRGHFAPLPFTDETDAIGLTSIAPLGVLEPEHANTLSGDVTWTRAPVEITATLFYSRVENALMFSEEPGSFVGRIVNAPQPTRTRGTEFIARHHEDNLDIIVTHMYLWSTEAADGGGTRESPLNPRHSGSFDLLWRFGASQIGVEAFYTGHQALERNPYRGRGSPYVLWGGLFMHRIGRAQLYLNAENLGDVRQTKSERLLLRQRASDGRWSTDAWAPLEGRTINAGLRLGF